MRAEDRDLRRRSTRRVKAYETGRCDAYTTDASGLYGARLKLAKADDHVLLPEIISKEPLSPFVRHGDDRWFAIVKWVHFAMVNAEEFNITRANVDEQLKSDKPKSSGLLGVEGNFGEQLGLTKDWVYRIVKLVGNYGEVFERTVGQSSPLRIARGLNALWSKGGLQYAPPIRWGGGSGASAHGAAAKPRIAILSSAAATGIGGAGLAVARCLGSSSMPRLSATRPNTGRAGIAPGFGFSKCHGGLRHQPDADRLFIQGVDQWRCFFWLGCSIRCFVAGLGIDVRDRDRLRGRPGATVGNFLVERDMPRAMSS